jgi:putative membrane-bound dehydrogenase-like protein
MKRNQHVLFAILFLSICFPTLLPAAQPLRVFLRAGVKTHGPGQHDHPRFLAEWKEMLNQRGAKADGAMDFPTDEQLQQTDVLVMFAAEAGTIAPEQRQSLDRFLARGGGMVCLHDAVCGKDAQWFKTVIGGAWEHGHSKWYEGNLSFYYMDTGHPITQGVSNFELDDELYYELHMMPEARVLAATYTPNRPNNGRNNNRGGSNKPSVYDIQPQMWTYEKGDYRAFVSILGHNYKTFELPHVRAVMLRGIAWAGKRANVDELCRPEELASLRYPEGGPTAPEKAAAKLEVHPDFTIQLVASEPLINKPINIDWDPAGRLWVVETPEYPNGRREPKAELQATPWKDSGFRVRPPVQQRPAIDRISLLTDTDGDGRMDHKEVFYEGLELATSMVFYRDGVIVSQAPDILWLRDGNGDGKAEKVETLYTGLGIGDTHAVINNLRWAADGWIYATHGYSASAHVYNGDKSRDFGAIGSGVVRFRPDGTLIEMVSSKGGNTWGMEIAPDQELFFTQPTSGDLLNHIVLSEGELARGKVGGTASYKPVIRGQKSFPLITYEQQAYVQIDLVGYFTAAAGAAIYGGGAWPSEYNYSYFTTEPTINIVHHEVVEANGVTFKAHKTREAEFIGGRDKWFRPIDTRIGPDGALYLTDFYNQAVVHNDTRGTMHGPANAAVRPDRDHYFGRIWRVNHRQAKKLEVPDLTRAKTADLVKALQHPNQDIRLTATRLLVERSDKGTAKALQPLLASWNFRGLEEAQMLALWVLHRTGQLPSGKLGEAVALDGKPTVQKAALRIMAELPEPKRSELTVSALRRLQDSNARVRLQALSTLATVPSTPAIRQAVLERYPDLEDPWLESAALGVAAKAPVESIEAAALSRKPAELRGLVTQLASAIAAKADAADAARLVIALASKPITADPIKEAALEPWARSQKSGASPDWSNELEKALRTLLGSPNPALSATALPLAARWDKRATLADSVNGLVRELTTKLKDETQSDDTRAQTAASLVGVRQLSPEIIPAVAQLVGSSATVSLQKRVIESLGSVPDGAVGKVLVDAYPKLTSELQEAVFAQVIKRSEWAMGLVNALEKRTVSLAMLGPNSVHRLRTHSDVAVARKAGEVLETLRGPEIKEKNTLLVKFVPEVEKAGNVEAGKTLFTQNCAVCHRLNGEGKEVGPDLSGMGAHGPAELLTAVLDPNREVDPSFNSWSIETKDGESYDGVIVSENRTTVTLRNNSGETVLKTADIQSRRNSGRSLMPEGFESLGGEALRDILAFVCGGETRYRIVDLRPAFTANGSEGLYLNRENTSDTLSFRKFGVVKAADVPFEILHPNKTTAGRNLIVLKGGQGVSKTYPRQVEVKNLNLKASRLHFLGGIGGWAYPCCGENKNENLPVAKVTVSFAEGSAEEFVFKNGVEFADHVGNYDVPGSKSASDLVRTGQVRVFSRALKNRTAIHEIRFESYDNAVAPTFVAVTADTSESAPEQYADASAQATTQSDASAGGKSSSEVRWGSGIKVLMFGGGSSHDFPKWFDQADSATLNREGLASANYTDKPSAVAGPLAQAEVLYQSSNQKLDERSLRQAIMAFADAGKGLVLVHAGLWYNWADWPEYNRVLAGGGARSHDKYGEFEVKLTEPGHPVLKGVPAEFKLTDELYHSKLDEQANKVQVLATSRNLMSGQTYPSVWIVKHPKARIVCIALGHDGKAHNDPAYQTLLRNAVSWAAGK